MCAKIDLYLHYLYTANVILHVNWMSKLLNKIKKRSKASHQNNMKNL